jgi:hypothetical protein
VQPLGLQARLRDFSREHALLIPGLLILLNGALLTLTLLRERNLRRVRRD